MAIQSLYCEWNDVNGSFYRSRNYVPLAAGVGALLAAEQALCNAAIVQNTVNGTTIFTGNVATPGQYDNLYQIGQVTYTTVLGSAVRVMLPAPIAANLNPDGITFNPAALAGLDVAVLGVVTDNLGNLATVRTSAVLVNRLGDQQ